MLGFAVKAARRAGDLISRASENIDKLNIQHKTTNDLVSEVDRAAEEAIIDSLKKVYPDHAFLGEKAAKWDLPTIYGSLTHWTGRLTFTRLPRLCCLYRPLVQRTTPNRSDL